MKIIYFIGALSLSGGTLVMARHVNALNRMGHSATLACLRQDDGYDFKTPLIRLSSLEELAALKPDLTIVCQRRDMVDVRRKLKNTLFFVQDRPLQTLASYYAAREKLPRYANPLGRVMLNFRRWRDKKLLESAFPAEAPVWCVSPLIADELRQWRGGIKARIIRNAIDAEPCRETQKNGVCRIVCIGDPGVQVKNIERAMDALKTLKARRTAHVIHISSGGTLKGPLAEVADEVFINLRHEKVLEICRQSHILFSPSLCEGFGLPAVEGMACGMLCVLSDIPAYHAFHKGNPDAQEPYALYFDPLDVNGMERTLDSACENFNTPAMERLRQNGLDVASWYSEEGMTQDLAAAIEAFRHP